MSQLKRTCSFPLKNPIRFLTRLVLNVESAAICHGRDFVRLRSRAREGALEELIRSLVPSVRKKRHVPGMSKSAPTAATTLTPGRKPDLAFKRTSEEVPRFPPTPKLHERSVSALPKSSHLPRTPSTPPPLIKSRTSSASGRGLTLPIPIPPSPRGSSSVSISVERPETNFDSDDDALSSATPHLSTSRSASQLATPTSASASERQPATPSTPFSSVSDESAREEEDFLTKFSEEAPGVQEEIVPFFALLQAVRKKQPAPPPQGRRDTIC